MWLSLWYSKYERSTIYVFPIYLPALSTCTTNGIANANKPASINVHQQLSIYSNPDPEILLVETSSPLEEQIGAARRQVQGTYREGRAYVQGWVNKWISVEQAVESTFPYF